MNATHLDTHSHQTTESPAVSFKAEYNMCANFSMLPPAKASPCSWVYLLYAIQV